MTFDLRFAGSVATMLTACISASVHSQEEDESQVE